MNRTKIEWCEWTWNPVVGCSRASAGCDHCYAAAISRRFGLPWGQAHFMPERLDEPAKVKKPGLVFCGSMTDLGHPTVKPAWRRAIWAAMRAAPWHQYIILTKRPGLWLRMGLPQNVWVGVSVEDKATYRDRWCDLQWYLSGTWRRLRFVSVEPMLGPVRLLGQRPDWVIAGPETGPGARECQREWLDDLEEEALLGHIPFSKLDVLEAETGKIPFFDKRREKWIRREWPGGWKKNSQ